MLLALAAGRLVLAEAIQNPVSHVLKPFFPSVRFLI